MDGNRQSVLAISLDAQGRQLGALSFDCLDADAFTDAHAAALEPVGDLLALGVQHIRLWAHEQERRRRREQLERLLPTIAEALDIRAVFPRLSAVIQDVVAHVTASAALLTEDGQGFRVHVASNDDVSELPEYRFSADKGVIRSNWRSFVAYDAFVLEQGVVRLQTPPYAPEPVFTELRPGPAWTRILTEFGIRSLLRVPIRKTAGAEATA